MLNKLSAFLVQEANVLHLRLIFARILLAPLPLFVGGYIRAAILRWIGFRIGSQSIIWDVPTFIGPGNIYQRFITGKQCWIGVQVFFDLADCIVIGDRTSIGPQCMFITGAHEIGDATRRVGKLTPKPIQLGDGVWIGARVTIMPGVTIGDGAVVGAAAVVTRDVPPNTLVAGVPARVMRSLE